MSEQTQAMVELELCDGCRLIPVSHLSFDLDEPMSGWPAWLERQEIDVMEDDCGREAISRVVFRQLVLEQASRRKLQLERDAARAASAVRVKKPRVSAAPALEGMSPYESMVAADGGIITPEQEFGHGREKPRFLEEALEQSQREMAQQRAENAEKKRLAAQMRKDLR